MRVEHLYRMTFRYPESWGGVISGEHGSEGHYYFIAEGRAEGRIAGRLRGANHPVARVDGNALPNFQGAIETDDGAHILFDLRGYARPYPVERRQIVVSGTREGLAQVRAKLDRPATLLDAQRQIRQARQSLIKAQSESLTRLADIERLIGEDL